LHGVRTYSARFPQFTVFLAFLAGMGCSAKEATTIATETLSDCNPVDDTHCMLPFPSSYHLKADDSTASGVRVAFGETTLPTNFNGVVLRPTYFNEKDGFSTLGTLYAGLMDASIKGVIGHDDLGAYADEDARTILLNPRTDTRQPHFVERETQAAEAGRDLLMLRPVVPLLHATQYVVGIRNLVDDQGDLVAGPDGFAALRDNTDHADPAIEAQRAHYEQVVFPALEQQGFERDTLQLAWSFTTGSKEGTTGRSVWMRDDALERLDSDGGSYVIETVIESDCSETGITIGRSIEGTISVPVYLNEWDLGSVLTRDADGQPYYNGQADAPFILNVPCTLLDDPRPARVIQYGHGLFAKRDEVHDEYLGQLAQENGFILMAMGWTGMTLRDSPTITLMLVEDPTEFAMIPERVMQSYVEWIYAARVVQGVMTQDDALTVDGQSLVHPDQLSFYGNSQGGVLGGGFMALSPDIDRGVLGVGGTPFTLLLTRSKSFKVFITLMESMYEDWADISLLLGAMQIIWDPGESAGYAHFLTDAAVDERTPTKDVLIHAGIGDASVTTLGAHIMARAYGADLVDPITRDIWGVQTRQPPFAGSAMVEFDWGVEEETLALPNADPYNTHDGPRWSEEGRAQVGAFLSEGIVIHTCDGACDPD
jgi:hypothetical protein